MNNLNWTSAHVATMDLEGFEVQIQIGKNTWDRDSTKKARIYGNGYTDVDFTEAYELQKANGYQAKGENPAEDKLFAQLNRQVVRNMREVIEQAAAKSPELAELIAVGFNFSKYAGCGSCPCSPGFVAKSHISIPSQDGRYNRNVTSIFITRK